MFRKRRKASDFDAEIEAHLQLEADRLQRDGMSESEARMAARRTFGNRTLARERFYESRRWRWWDVLARDIRFGLRMMARNPVSSVVAILTLALGIGANTAIFSLLDALLLRNLPVEQPQQLSLFGSGVERGNRGHLPNRSWQLFSYPFYRECQERNEVFSSVTAIDSVLSGTHGHVANSASLEKIDVALVSGTYFQTLGVKPIFGRSFTEADDRVPGGAPIAVASYAWWHDRLRNDPAVIGTKVTINSTVYRIVGVAPPGFFGAIVGQSPDLWVPLTMEKEISPGWNGLDKKLFQSLYIIGRRKPGVSVHEADANANLIFKQFLHSCIGSHPSAKQLQDIRHARIDLTSAATGLSAVRHQYSSLVKILMALVALVLLIACANIANLLLARAAARQRELATRMSVGAGRWRLIRQLLIESGLIGLAGAAVGVALAWEASRLLLWMVSDSPGQPLPLYVKPDLHVLGFTLAATILTVLLFGMAPAFYATRLDLISSLREGRGMTVARGRSRLARGLIVGQVALALALLVGAGLFLHSLVNLLSVNTGFDERNVLITSIDPGAAGYKPSARLENLMKRVEERVDSLPGIHGASFAFSVFDDSEWTVQVTVPGRPHSPTDPQADLNIVGPQYFQVVKMPIVLGRGLLPSDNSAAPKVAVINQTMARIYFPGISPLGRTFSVASREWHNVRVVGVVKDAKYMDLTEKQMPAAFYPHAQHNGPFILYDFVARAGGNPKSAIPEIEKAIHEVDPNLPVNQFFTLAEVVDNSVHLQQLIAQLSTFFGIVAAFLACIGLYGVLSHAIARRTNEFGIRMALGAERGDVLWMVLGEALRLILVGVAIGLVLAFAFSRMVAGSLFGLSTYNPEILVLASVAMTGTALLAAYVPARRATRIDPMIALRYE